MDWRSWDFNQVVRFGAETAGVPLRNLELLTPTKRQMLKYRGPRKSVAARGPMLPATGGNCLGL